MGLNVYGTVTSTGNSLVSEGAPIPPPTISSVPDITQAAGLGLCSAVVTYSPTITGSSTTTYSTTGAGATPSSGSGTGTGSTFNVGTTHVVISVTNGCHTTVTSTVNVTVTPNTLSVIATPTPVSCNAANGGTHNNGAISTTVSGGVGPYSYTWTGGASGPNPTSLTAGTYSVSVTDGGCTGETAATASAVVGAPTAITASATGHNVSCNHLDASGTINNGYVTITDGGGTGPLSITGTPTSATSGLTTGTYNYTITDTKGCTATTSASVGEPAVLTVTAGNVSVCAGSTVTLPGSPTGGNWSVSNPNSSTVAGTHGYTYTYTKGPFGNTATSTVTVNALPSLSATITNVSCYGGSNGSIVVTVTGGSGYYTYSWSPCEGSSSSITGKPAGNYTVTVTDTHTGCSATHTYTIGQPSAALSVSGTVTNVTCYGGSNGSITTSVTGGTSSYTYSWSPCGGTSANLTGKTAGTYVVTVTDAHGCTATHSFTIGQPSAPLSVSGTVTNVTCNGGDNGKVTTSVSGGTSSYTYTWSPASGTSANITGKTAGTYAVTVTDAHGCSASHSFAITQPAPVSCSVSCTPSTTTYTGGVPTNFYLGYGPQSGTFNTTCSGGSGFTYSWSCSGGTSCSKQYTRRQSLCLHLLIGPAIVRITLHWSLIAQAAQIHVLYRYVL